MPTISLPKFNHIHQRIKAVFENECEEKGLSFDPSVKYQYYGYDSYNEDEPSILKSMKEHPDTQSIAGLASLKGRYILDRLKSDKFKTEGVVPFKSTNLKIYLAYIGESDKYEEYTKPDEEQITEHKFKGYFYYYSRNKVEEFSFSLFQNDSKEFVSAREEGFHKSTHQVFECQTNSVIRVDDILYVNMKNDRGHQMNLVIKVFGYEIESWNYLSCTLSAVTSSNLIPIGVRCMLVKIENDNSNSNTTKEKILQQYLMLKRNAIRSYVHPISLEDLKDRGARIDRIRSMIGTWRIWRFGDEGDKVLQSKLVINSDYSARVFVPDILDENHAQQVVVFSISQAGEKLCYSSHPARGRQVLSYGIIKLPTRNNKTTILKGAYTNLWNDRDNHTPPFGGLMMLLKDNNDFRPESLKIGDELIQYLSENNPDVTLLWNEFPENKKKLDS